MERGERGGEMERGRRRAEDGEGEREREDEEGRQTECFHPGNLSRVKLNVSTQAVCLKSN